MTLHQRQRLPPCHRQLADAHLQAWELEPTDALDECSLGIGTQEVADHLADKDLKLSTGGAELGDNIEMSGRNGFESL